MCPIVPEAVCDSILHNLSVQGHARTGRDLDALRHGLIAELAGMEQRLLTSSTMASHPSTGEVPSLAVLQVAGSLHGQLVRGLQLWKNKKDEG